MTAIKRRCEQALGRTVSSLGQHIQQRKGVGRRAVRKTIKEFKRQRKQQKDIFHG